LFRKIDLLFISRTNRQQIPKRYINKLKLKRTIRTKTSKPQTFQTEQSEPQTSKMSKIISYENGPVILQRLLFTHYCVYELHNMIDDSMTKHFKNVMDAMPPGIYTPTINHEYDSDEDEIAQIEVSPSYNVVSGTKTLYTSHYKHHVFLVLLTRNPNDTVEVCATIRPTVSEETHESILEKDTIFEIAFVSLLKRLQYHARHVQTAMMNI
jgi:hypothetical protein